MSERDNNNNGTKKNEIQVYEIQRMSQREKRWDEQQKEYKQIWEREEKKHPNST